jgi:hypothetical protein
VAVAVIIFIKTLFSIHCLFDYDVLKAELSPEYKTNQLFHESTVPSMCRRLRQRMISTRLHAKLADKSQSSLETTNKGQITCQMIQ